MRRDTGDKVCLIVYDSEYHIEWKERKREKGMEHDVPRVSRR